MVRRRNPKVICPRCGKEGRLTRKYVYNKIGKKYYYWFVQHYIDGKVKWCYLTKKQARELWREIRERKKAEKPKIKEEIKVKAEKRLEKPRKIPKAVLKSLDDMVKIYSDGKLLMDIEIEGKSNQGKYKAIYRVEALPNSKFPSVQDLKEYVEFLAQRYPERGFRLYQIPKEKPSLLRRIINFLLRRKIKPYYVVAQRKISKKDAITLIFDLDRREVYLARRDLSKPKKLRNYLIFRALGSLKLVQSKYVRTIGRD